MLTARDTQRLLARHGLAPRRAAGQHFVVDPNTVRRIVTHARLEPTDTVVEIGAGLGSLTVALADAARRVVAVEIDAGLVRALTDVVAGLDQVEVVHADALSLQLSTLAGGPARLVANLPYNVATPLLVHALLDDAITDAFVMVQREVGERWAARPGDPAYGGVSLKLALLADAEISLRVPRTVFLPEPNVDSVMVRVTRRMGAPTGTRREHMLELVDLAFASRRKTLRNTLRVRYGDEVAAALERARIAPSARAETLDVAALERLAPLLDAGAPASES